MAEGLPLLLKEGATSYVYGPGGLPLERIDAAGAVAYCPDHRRPAHGRRGAAGAVVGTFSYDAYGKPTASTGSVSTPFGFAGEYADAETGFVYLRARYYDPATGQFISRDPLVALTRSAYGYADGNPLNGTDPMGLLTLRGVLRTAAAITGGLAVGALLISAAPVVVTSLTIASAGFSAVAAYSDFRRTGTCGEECQLDEFNVVTSAVPFVGKGRAAFLSTKTFAFLAYAAGWAAGSAGYPQRASSSLGPLQLISSSTAGSC